MLLLAGVYQHDRFLSLELSDFSVLGQLYSCIMYV